MAQPLGRHHDKTRTSWTPAGPSSAAQSMWPVSLRGPFLNALDRLLTPVECELHHRGQNIPPTHPRAKHHNLNSRPFFLLRWAGAGIPCGWPAWPGQQSTTAVLEPDCERVPDRTDAAMSSTPTLAPGATLSSGPGPGLVFEPLVRSLRFSFPALVRPTSLS